MSHDSLTVVRLSKPSLASRCPLLSSTADARSGIRRLWLYRDSFSTQVLRREAWAHTGLEICVKLDVTHLIADAVQNF
jgi:hypothetical protein